MAKKGHDEEVPWAAGFLQEAGMAMGCRDECHGVEREDRDKGERCVRCVPRCRGGCVGVRNVFLAFQETETHNPITDCCELIMLWAH